MTDDEFVERIRRQMSRSRTWPRIWLTVWGMLFVGFSIFFFWAVSDVKRTLVNGSAYNLGFFLGATMGCLFIFALSNFFHALTAAFFPHFRLHQLLVKYYDDAVRPASTKRHREDRSNP